MAKWILIAALAFVFGYFGIDKFVHPEFWLEWIPSWLDGLMGLGKNTWLMVIGGTEILFALLILTPVRRMRQAGSILIALHLAGILTQVGWNDIAVRDSGLLLSSVALFFIP